MVRKRKTRLAFSEIRFPGFYRKFDAGGEQMLIRQLLFSKN